MTRDERQSLVIDKWKSAGGKGIVLACTGFGKSRVTLNLIQRLLVQKKDLKVIVVVPTSYLQGQWMLNVNRAGVNNNVEVLIINTASKRKLKCDLLVVDECHTSVSNTYFSIYEGISHRMFLGLTATLKRLDGLESKLLELYPVIDEVTLDEAIENSWVAPYKQYKVLLNVDLADYENYNAAFLHNFASFDYNFDVAMKSLTDPALRARLSRLTGRPVKDIMIHAINFNRALQARKKFIHDHSAKIEVANKIIRARTNSKIITFTKQVSHAEQICCGDVYHGKLKKKERDLILKRFIEAETGVINTNKMFDVGVDIPGVNTGIVLSGDSSVITKSQRVGRFIRYAPGRVGEVWNLVIKGTVEEKWFEKSNSDLDYETVEDYQLDDLLNGNEYREKEVKFEFIL